ncbi:MAG: IreB family regulatory phosphoprotein [Clostridia bacterium]|nr:IreB family regulatory phosphoprotein [Clostridia bacterium]
MQDTKNVHEEQAALPNAQSTLCEVYRALNEKGYDPITQIVGYLLTEDPTYITNYGNARSMIRRVDRNDLLEEIVSSYFSEKEST